MINIEITVPLAMTTTQIIRAVPTISEGEARGLAQELHEVIALVQSAYAAHVPERDADPLSYSL